MSLGDKLLLSGDQQSGADALLLTSIDELDDSAFLRLSGSGLGGGESEMSDKELFELPELESGGFDGAMGVYLVDPVNGSRYVTLEELKIFINTDPTVVPSSVPWRGARVSLTANQSIGNNSSTAVSWGTADIDTDSFWSAGAPTRLTVPSGVTKVRLRIAGRWNSNATGVRQIALGKAGSLTLEGRASSLIAAGVSTNHEQNAGSGVLSVSASDYFEMFAFQTSGGALNLLDTPATWFEIEVVEASV